MTRAAKKRGRVKISFAGGVWGLVPADAVGGLLRGGVMTRCPAREIRPGDLLAVVPQDEAHGYLNAAPFIRAGGIAELLPVRSVEVS